MRVGPKIADQFTVCNDSSIWVFNQYLVRKYHSSIYFENMYISVWVPNSEEKNQILEIRT
jgi:hypothetical protein